MVSEVREYRVFGPPGTGKTTYLAAQVRKAVEKRGPSEVFVASFTRAAASELAGRGLPIGRHQIGTLHSHAYRALGSPPIAETPEVIAEWNLHMPQYALSGGATASALDEPATEVNHKTEGDALMHAMQNYRARRIPREQWRTTVKAFADRWEAFKRDTGTVDFTDMIEYALRDVPQAPGNPSVGVVDEVQDMTALELALVRSWGQHMDIILMAGDDDQCIYNFKGATPDAFLTPPVPDEQKRTLSQSYRVPAAVHALSQKWIARLSSREPKEYKPREHPGEVRRLHAGSYRDPEPILKDAEQYMAQGKTIMFLTSCSYMLSPMISLLRREGIPFHNPYRTKRGDWNPLGGGGGVTSAERLLAYLSPQDRYDAPIDLDDPFLPSVDLWTHTEIKRWAEVIKADGVFKRGAKARISELSDDYKAPLDLGHVSEYLEDEALRRAVAFDVDWFEESLLSTRRGPMQFPLTVYRKRGKQALIETPKVIVGTVHSVKGGQADVVYLFPDLSRAGMIEWMGGGAASDAVRRMFYVGMTRAYETLVLCEAGSPFYVLLGVD